MFSLLTSSTAALSTTDVAHQVDGQNFAAMGWLRHALPPAPTEEVTFTLSLKQRNLDQLKARALSVNTPGNPDYGMFLKQAEIDELTAPSTANVRRGFRRVPTSPGMIGTCTYEPYVTPSPCGSSANPLLACLIPRQAGVQAWLREHDVAYTMQREALHVTTTVAQASALLQTNFSAYSQSPAWALYNRNDERTLLRAADFYLPADVEAAVAATFGLHGIPMPSPAQAIGRADGDGATAPAKVTPAVIAATYTVGKPKVDHTGKNRQAVAEFQGQYMSKPDLAKYFTEEVPSAQSGDDEVAKFVGVPYKAGHGVEALLDM